MKLIKDKQTIFRLKFEEKESSGDKQIFRNHRCEETRLESDKPWNKKSKLTEAQSIKLCKKEKRNKRVKNMSNLILAIIGELQ